MSNKKPSCDAAALVRRYSAQYTKDAHKKTPLWHDGYVQVHHMTKLLVLMDDKFTPLDSNFVPHSVTGTTSLPASFYLPDDFECNIGNLKVRVESYESEFMADLTEIKDAKKDARKRVRDWAAEEDSKSPGGSKQSYTPAKRLKSDAPSFRSPANHTPLMPRSLKSQYKPSALKSTYVRQEVDSPNDLSYLDDDSADEGTPASPYIQSGASKRLMASLKGDIKPDTPGGKSATTPGSSRKAFKVPKLAGTPLRAATPFKAPSAKVVAKEKDDQNEEEVMDQAALIRSRLKVNWSALG